MKPIWIVDDDQSIRWVLEKALAREQLQSRSFSNIRDTLAALENETPQVLLSDIRMPGGSGLELLQAVKKRHPDLPVIVMTAYSDLDSAVSAFQGGAFEYLAKPFDIDKAVELIRRAVEESLRETAVAEHLVDAPEILGQAPAMQEVFRAIGRLSPSNVTVMITGESGSGKELVARALHKHSPRTNGPFIALNTAAIPKDLLESELFGHERGAFTGAQTMRRGRFEQAEGGTLFLDEIGDMPFDLQTRLLRVLSDGNFYRVGGHQPIKSNVRVIAATHQNLENRVKEGMFREDLFHRLNVIRLRLPPLRERREDIPLLVKHFMQKSAQELGMEPKRVSDEAMQVISHLPFPGNVRQLENTCHWLSVMAPAQTIEAKDLPAELLATSVAETIEPALENSVHSTYSDAEDKTTPVTTQATPVVTVYGTRVNQASREAGDELAQALSGNWEEQLGDEARAMLKGGQTEVFDALLKRFEKTVIQAALEITRGRRVEAAERLGIGRNTITRKLQDFGMDDA